MVFNLPSGLLLDSATVSENGNRGRMLPQPSLQRRLFRLLRGPRRVLGFIMLALSDKQPTE